MVSAAADRTIVAVQDVLLELERQDDDVFAWAKQHVTFVPLEDEIQASATDILARLRQLSPCGASMQVGHRRKARCRSGFLAGGKTSVADTATQEQEQCGCFFSLRVLQSSLACRAEAHGRDRDSPPSRRAICATLLRGSLRLNHERRLVSQRFASWNLSSEFLRRVEALRRTRLGLGKASSAPQKSVLSLLTEITPYAPCDRCYPTGCGGPSRDRCARRARPARRSPRRP